MLRVATLLLFICNALLNGLKISLTGHVIHKWNNIIFHKDVFVIDYIYLHVCTL